MFGSSRGKLLVSLAQKHININSNNIEPDLQPEINKISKQLPTVVHEVLYPSTSDCNYNAVEIEDYSAIIIDQHDVNFDPLQPSHLQNDGGSNLLVDGVCAIEHKNSSPENLYHGIDSLCDSDDSIADKNYLHIHSSENDATSDDESITGEAPLRKIDDVTTIIKGLLESVFVNAMLASDTREREVVCKTFFLATLGYLLKNDKLLRNVLSYGKSGKIVAKRDHRGIGTPHNKFDTQIISNHIETFNPVISHYRREHAPNRRYLPIDISIKMMYNNFRNQYPQHDISYALYRREVVKKNISFVKLGHEECWSCESFLLHEKSTSHTKENIRGMLVM
ncbi:hypothetical protein QE152_g22289 [Popillia japonica]|uniref:Uncharacterized protein n=1 Tax=Popillia japonica TaxID=7064 RepID=A0AAW1KM38_POPJA